MKFFKRLICAINGHGGIYIISTRTGRCNKCGMHVKFIKD